jgi:hypothetical protein
MEDRYIPVGAVMRDELHYPDGRVVYLPEVRNTIQLTFSALMAKLASGKDATAITRMEVGSGDPGWDAAPPPPAPGNAQTALLNPIGRSAAFVPGTDWVYLQTPPTIPETVVGGPTSRVQVTIVFAIGTVNGTLREAALYGGNLATGTSSTGDLVNVLRHTAINKPAGGSDFQLTRKVILQF